MSIFITPELPTLAEHPAAEAARDRLAQAQQRLARARDRRRDLWRAEADRAAQLIAAHRAAGGGVHGVDALVWEVTRDWVRDGIGAPTLMGDHADDYLRYQCQVDRQDRTPTTIRDRWLVVVDSADTDRVLSAMHPDVTAEVRDASAEVSAAAADGARLSRPWRPSRRPSPGSGGDLRPVTRDIDTTMPDRRADSAARCVDALSLAVAMTAAQRGGLWTAAATPRDVAAGPAREAAAGPYGWWYAVADITRVPAPYWRRALALSTGTHIHTPVPTQAAVAARYLTEYCEVNAALAAMSTPREVLTYTDSAEAAGVTVTAWRTAVSSGAAPAPDADGGTWYRETVTAWRIASGADPVDWGSITATDIY